MQNSTSTALFLKTCSFSFMASDHNLFLPIYIQISHMLPFQNKAKSPDAFQCKENYKVDTNLGIIKNASE